MDMGGSVSKMSQKVLILKLGAYLPYMQQIHVSWTWIVDLQVYLYPWIRGFTFCVFMGLVLLLVVAAATSRSRWLRKGGRIGEADPRRFSCREQVAEPKKNANDIL